MVDRVFDLWGVYDNKEKVICLVRNTDAKDLCDLLNEFADENKKLKQRNEFLKKQLDRVCIDNEEMGDKLKKIERIL